MKLIATLLILLGQALMPCEHQYIGTKLVPVFSTRLKYGFLACRVVEERCMRCGKTRWMGRE